MTEGKWIRFEEAEPKPKTKVWNVVARDGNILLGTVSWFAPWRGYAFGPNLKLSHLVFERGCLRDIADFIEEQNKAHRAAKKGAKDGR